MVVRSSIGTALLVLLVSIELTQLALGNKLHPDADCYYNRCEFKIAPWKYSGHAPCQTAGGRQRVRDVDCEDGNSYHICCRMPYRPEVTRSRSAWLRAVTTMGNQLSRQCVWRMLCEQACLDGLTTSDLERTDYPQLMSVHRESEHEQQYIAAWNEGENQACYGLHNAQPRPADSSKGAGRLYITTTAETCRSNCSDKFPRCESEMKDSFVLQSYDWSVRIFHRLGVWIFTLLNQAREDFHEYVRHPVQVRQAVRSVFTDWHRRMVEARRKFDQYLAEINSKLASGSALEQQWRQFLVTYNRTDQELVSVLFDSLAFDQFNQAILVMDQTLASADFGSSSAVGLLHHGSVLVLMVVLWSVPIWLSA